MKRTLIILAGALLLGAITYFVCFRIATQPTRRMVSVNDELVWLTTEFRLNPEQTKRIKELHAAYEPRCMEMCRKIAENNAQLDRLIAGHREITPEMERLLRESADIQVECRRELLAYVYSVAAVMPQEEGDRYVSLLKTQVLQPGTPYSSIVATHMHE